MHLILKNGLFPPQLVESLKKESTSFFASFSVLKTTARSNDDDQWTYAVSIKKSPEWLQMTHAYPSGILPNNPIRGGADTNSNARFLDEPELLGRL